MNFLMKDFTDRELVCDMDDNSSVSSLGTSSSSDDESDDGSISSEEKESPAEFLKRRRNSKARKDPLSRNKMNRLRHNLTAPDFKMPQMAVGNKSTANANARWGVKETTRTLSHMSITPPSSKKNLRKATSIDSSIVSGGNDRWTATSAAKKAMPKLTNEVLLFTTDDKPTAAANGTRWSPTLTAPKIAAPGLKRTKSTDHAPTAPRPSWTDLQNFQRSMTGEAAAPSANARWSSTPKKPASRSNSTKNSMLSLTRTRSRRGKRESAPDLLLRRLSHAVSPNEDDSGNGKNARWTSSPSKGASDFHLSCSDLSLSQELKRPSLRGSLNRWDSCSNFTVETLTSIDQLSTKPKLPKRRNRRSSKSKKESTPSSQPNNEEEQVEALKKEELQDMQTVMGTISKEDHSSVVSSSSCSSIEEAKESTEVEEPQETSAMVHSNSEEPTTDVLQAEENSDDVEDDSSLNELDLGYDCFECFETIQEEEDGNDEESILGPPTLDDQISDTLMRAPKRRKSMITLGLLEDDESVEEEDEQSIISMSLNDTSSISFSRRTECTAASTYVPVQDCLSHSGHKRRAPEPRTASYMPRQPRRRDSIGGLSLCSHSSAESGDKDQHIRGGSGNRPRLHTTTGTHPLAIIRRRSRESNGDEKHPLWELNDTNAPAMTGASLRMTSSSGVFPMKQESACGNHKLDAALHNLRNNPAA